MKGDLCGECLNRTFWYRTLPYLTLGRWGMTSFAMTWYSLIWNLVLYVQAHSDPGKMHAQRALADLLCPMRRRCGCSSPSSPTTCVYCGELERPLRWWVRALPGCMALSQWWRSASWTRPV